MGVGVGVGVCICVRPGIPMCVCVCVCVGRVCLHCYFYVGGSVGRLFGRLVAIKRMRVPWGNYESGFLLFRIVSRLHATKRYERVCVSVAARYLPFPLIANATVAANLRYTLLTPRLAPFEPVISNADCSIEYLLISIPISKWNGQSKPKSLASLQQRYEF